MIHLTRMEYILQHFWEKNTFLNHVKIWFLFILWSLPFCTLMLYADTDITKSTYTIDTSLIDPMNTNHSSSDTTLAWLFATLSDLLLIAIVVFAAIAWVVAWYLYTFSGLDDGNIKRSRQIITINIVALFIALFSYSIIQLVAWLISV